jgi:hypothetical protein
MINPTIRYRTGYKHQLHQGKVYPTRISGIHMHLPPFLTLHKNGELLVEAGYAWDGASGPAVDTLAMIAGSCPHDALYQLLRHGLPERYRSEADRLFKEVYLAATTKSRPSNKFVAWFWDKATAVRAFYTHLAVSKAAESAASPKNAKPILTAP